MSEKTFTTVLHVQLDGVTLPDPLAVRLTEGWVDASVNVPSAFQLTFSDKDGTLTEKFPFLKVGAMAVLSPFTDGRLGAPMLTGEVTALETDAAPTLGRYLIVRGYDPGHRLLRNRRVEGYPNMTASDIVRKVAALNRVPLGQVDATPTVYELATQPNITDWDFLSRLAQANDVRLAVDPAGRLTFAALPPAASAPADTTPAAQSPYVLDFGHNTLHSRVSVTAAGQVGRVDVRGWDPRTKQALSSPTPAASSTEIVSDITPAQLSAPFGTAELTLADRPFTTQSEVRQAARSLADDVTGSFAEVEVAVTGNPELKPGQPVAVKGAGFPFEGRYTATGVRHVFASGRQFTSWLTVSGRQFRSLYGTAAGGGEPAPPMPGVAVALVTNTKDPLSLGRVRLRFPWLSATYESDWCRVAQLGGRGGGGLMLPDVDDEVLCAFDRGSLEHPYVLAGLYNGVDKHTPATDRVPPVDPTSGRVQWRALTSRTGHTVELREEGGGRTRASHGIRLRTAQGKLSIELNEARTTLTVDSDGTVTISGARGVTVESGADLTLSALGKISLNAGTGVDIKSTMGVDIKAGTRFKASATQAVLNAPNIVTFTVPMPNPVIAASPL